MKQNHLGNGVVLQVRSGLVPFLALTATASPSTTEKIIKSLSLKKCLEIRVSPNRKNIKLFVLKVASDVSVNFSWLAREVAKMRVECPRTLIYVRYYKTCGELYHFFLSNLLDKAYYPDGAEKKSSNRIYQNQWAGQQTHLSCEHVLQLTSARALDFEHGENTSDFQKSLP